MLKVLIIGSEGFVGYNLVDGLSEKFQILTSDIEEKNGYLVIINLISSKQVNIQIPCAINQDKLKISNN